MQRVVDLSTKKEVFEVRGLIFVGQHHGSVHAVDNCALRLEAIGLIKKLLTPFPPELDLASETVDESPLVVLEVPFNPSPVILDSWVGYVDVSLNNRLSICFQHFIFQRKPTVLHIVVESMVTFLRSLPDGHHPWQKDLRGNLKAFPKELYCSRICVRSNQLRLLENELLRSATDKRPCDYVRRLA